MSAQTNEIQFAFGKVAQSGVLTANVSADFIRLPKMNASPLEVDPVVETDQADIGKGHEFAENSYLSHWNSNCTMEMQATSEILGWAFAFCLGSSSVAAAGTGFAHTSKLLNPITQGLDAPLFSMVEQVRPGGSAFIDRMAVGNAINELTLSVQNGPGRTQAKVNINTVGTGKLIQPSSITMPAVSQVHACPSGGLGLVLNGENYVTSRNIISVELNVKNNIRLDEGFFPGSGFQTSGNGATGQVRGRMEVGTREVKMTFSARMRANSPELAAVQSQSEGTCALSLVGPAVDGTHNHGTVITLHRTRYFTAKPVDSNGMLIVNCEVTTLYDAVNGVITAVTTNTIPTLGNE